LKNVFKLVHSKQFLCQSTQFITQPKCTVLIDTKVKGASPTCCGTVYHFQGAKMSG